MVKSCQRLQNFSINQTSKAHEPKRDWNPYFLTMRNSLMPGSRLTFLLFSLQWFPFHFCAISTLHISPACVSPLFELERIPPCSSALPNKPERDSLADSCSRWHYYTTVSQSAGSGSTTTGGGGCPSAVPTRQHQHQHMVVLCNTVSVGWCVNTDHPTRSPSFSSFVWWFSLTIAGLEEWLPFCGTDVCTYNVKFKAPVRNIEDDTLTDWLIQDTVSVPPALICFAQFTQSYISTYI